MGIFTRLGNIIKGEKEERTFDASAIIHGPETRLATPVSEPVSEPVSKPVSKPVEEPFKVASDEPLESCPDSAAGSAAMDALERKMYDEVRKANPYATEEEQRAKVAEVLNAIYMLRESNARLKEMEKQQKAEHEMETLKAYYASKRRESEKSFDEPQYDPTKDTDIIHRYISKPHHVEAVRWNGKNCGAVKDFCGEAAIIVEGSEKNTLYLKRTLGLAKVEAGIFILKIDDIFIDMNAEDFSKAYELYA